MTFGRSDIITGDVFTGKLARLRDVWLDPATVFDEVGVEQFVGRQWLVNAVDRFMAGHERGYLVIRGDAGIGKSTFAAWLARDRGWPCHFTRRRNGRVSLVALRNLAAQLIAGHDLADRFAPGGVLPETAGEPGWFDQVLRAAAREASERVVIVVDGLDEAEHVAGDLPLGLPAALPSGVFVIVTCRTGTDLPALRQPWQLVTISAQDRQNTADLRSFIALRCKEEPIAAELAAAGMPAKDLVRNLVRNTSGIWVYARYVLDEMHYGLRSPADLDRLPVDLAHYYAESLAPLLHASGLPLLATLAVAFEPLPADTLTRLAGLTDSAEVRRLCIGPLRPFLVSDDRGYGIYHHSLREHLTGTYRFGLAQVEELRAAAIDAHARIAATYLTAFGSLPGLPLLAADASLVALDGGYPLRYLTRHLEDSSQVDVLHTLLSTEAAARNVWFEAHNAAGTLDDYLADLSRGTQQARLATNRQVTAGRPATGLGLEVRYALMAASVATLTARVGVPLLVRLVTAGVWTVERAVAHVRQLHDLPSRVTALVELLPHLPEAARVKVAAEALAEARRVGDQESTARALGGIAPHLPERQAARVVAEALRAAGEIEGDRVEVLRDLIPVLPAHLGEQALAFALTVTDDSVRSDLLSDLVPALPHRLAADLHRALDTFEDEWDRARVLNAMASWLPEEQIPGLLAASETLAPELRAAVMAGTSAPALIDEALELAQATGAIAVHMVLPYLAETVQRTAATAALAEARRLGGAWTRVRVLAAFAPVLAEDEQDAVVLELISAARSAAAADEDDLASLMGFLAEDLPERHVPKLLALCRESEQPLDRSIALLCVADYLPPDHQRQVQEEALEDILSITDDRRYGALSYLAERVHESLTNTMLKVVSTLPESWARSHVMDMLAPRLPQHLLGQALAIAQLATDDRTRADLLVRLASHQPEPARQKLIREALTIARDTTFRGDRSVTFRWIAAVVDEPYRTEALDNAIAASREYSDTDDRAWALMLTAWLLTGTRRSAVHEEALDVARLIEDVNQRAWTLSRLAAQLPQPQRDEVLFEAAEAARRIKSGFFKVQVLTMIAGELSAAHRLEMLQEMRQAALDLGPSRSSLSTTLVRVVRYLPERLQIKLLDGVQAFCQATSEFLPADSATVGQIARLVDLLPARLITDALRITEAVSATYTLDPAWGALALHLSGPFREAALSQVFGSSSSTVLARFVLLNQAKSIWHNSIGVAELDVLRRALANLELQGCYRVVAAAVSILHAAGGAAVIDDCLESTDVVHRWWRSEPEASVSLPFSRTTVLIAPINLSSDDPDGSPQ